MKSTVKVHEKSIEIDSNASPDEILARAKEEGVELTDEQIEQVTGGTWGATTMPSEITQWITCNTCNGLEIEITPDDLTQGFVDCPGCGTRYVL